MAQDTKEKAKVQVPTVTLTIDGQVISVPKGTTVLEAAKGMGIDIPTFCWHPKLKAVGACRICYVEIEKFPKLQVSCATMAMDGMVVHTDSDQVRQGRKAVLEFILINHPLDCPTCDKGGECDLQNLTFKHGFDDSRFDFQKYRFVDEGMTATFDDARIGPEIMLNRNRCILCYKCVRANKEAFGEFDLGAYERGNITEINAAPGRKVANPFSGNLVEICPVGALTNTDWRYKIRVWLTTTAASIDPFYSSGVNIKFWKEDHRKHIFRVTSLRNDDIDDGWLSDTTRYGYQIVNAEDRLKKPLIKKDGQQVEASWDEALDTIKKRFNEIRDKKGSVCIGGLISPQLDNATLYSFNKFIRTTFNSNKIDYRFDYRMLSTSPDSPYATLLSKPFSIADIDDSDVIVSFASDLVREHPNEYVRIRKAYNFKRAGIFSISPYEMKAADVARTELVYKLGTDEVAINGICLAAVEEKLVSEEAAQDLLKKVMPRSLSEASAITGITFDEFRAVARALSEAKKVTILAGEILKWDKERETVAAALCNLVKLFNLTEKGQVAVLARYANSVGARHLGLLPEPNKAVKQALHKLWKSYPDSEPQNTDQMLVHMKKEEINGLMIVGANPVMLYPDREFFTESLEKLDFLVVCDMFETETTQLADVVLPLASWAEYGGDYVNLEGRLQTTEAALKPKFESKSGFEIINAIAEKFDNKLFENVGDCRKEMEQLLKLDHNVPWPVDYLEVKPAPPETFEEYPLPMFVCDDPHHSGYLTEKANSLVNFCGTAYIEMSPALAEKYELNEGDSVRVETEVGKMVLTLKISDYIDSEVVLVPRNFSSIPINSLMMRKRRFDWVKVTKVAGS